MPLASEVIQFSWSRTATFSTLHCRCYHSFLSASCWMHLHNTQLCHDQESVGFSARCLGIASGSLVQCLFPSWNWPHPIPSFSASRTVASRSQCCGMFLLAVVQPLVASTCTYSSKTKDRRQQGSSWRQLLHSSRQFEKVRGTSI